MRIRQAAAVCRRHSSAVIVLVAVLSSLNLLQAQAPNELPIRRVVLYKSGVGYFEHVGRVRGNQQMTIDFTSGQLDDVLKSLTALDLDGGRITNVGYNSEAGLEKRLSGLRLPVGQNASRAQFLSALRGARIEVRSGTTRSVGRLMSVEPIERGANGNVSRVDSLSLVTDAGEVNTIALDAGVTVKILDAELSQEVSRYLSIVGSVRDQDTRRLTISTAGTGDRDLLVSYVSEVPVWKATYRIVLPGVGEARPPLLQGWAIVDNTIGQDWTNVQLSLMAGAPQSFIMQISRPYYVQRPIVPLPERALFAPQTHQSALATGGSGGITGVVTDPSGGAIPGATVRVTRAGAAAGQTVTNAAGRYRFSNLSAASYQVTVTLQGFKTTTHPSVTVSSGMETIANAVLEVGAMTETLTVRASSPLIDTKRTSAAMSASGIHVANSSATDSFDDRVMAAQTALQSDATASQLGDLFEYKLREPITIRKNQSALVPIASGSVEAEKVSIWTAGGRTPRPLRAIWLHNTTPLTLDAGSFSIVEGQAFAGEGMMESLKAGERRLLSYALDLGLAVKEEGDDSASRTVRVRLNHGVLTRETEDHHCQTYVIRNNDAAARTLIVEHPASAGWKLTSTLAPAETTLGWQRFKVPVPARTTVTFTVEETRPVQEEFEISDLDDDEVAVFLRERAISPETKAVLEEVLRRKAEIAKLSDEVGAKEREIATITADQQRLRQNMQALKGSREERELLQRYVRQLNDQETKLESVRAELAKLEEARDKAEAALAEFIAKL